MAKLEKRINDNNDKISVCLQLFIVISYIILTIKKVLRKDAKKSKKI